MKFYFKHAGETHTLEITQGTEGLRAVVNGQNLDVRMIPGRDLELVVAGRPVRVAWAKHGRKTWLHLGGRSYELERAPGGRSGGQAAAAERSLRAPIPGQVRKVLVQAGQQVEPGAVLVLLEAMKMEVRIQAPQAAKVAQIAVTEGQSVDKDQLLVELEPDHAG